jgi:prolyl-tRNA editing enzyme YbaK/EbsC (Cys-tRNA(Pro) deacylase)
MRFGTLDFVPVDEQPSLVAAPTRDTVKTGKYIDIRVAGINTGLADTAAFCAAYQIGLDVSANCVIIEAKRADQVWYAACVLLATDRADINGIVRRHLNARKISFAAMEDATKMTGMEYGGINPIGLPEDWEILVDTAVTQKSQVIIGSGIRGSKLLVPGALLAQLPKATVMDLTKK